MSLFKFVATSEKATQQLASKLGEALEKNDCLALVGDFGSGKTTFVKGLARGLKVAKKDYVCSPSFVILKIYRGRLPLFHFDLYRLRTPGDAEAVGLGEFLSAQGVAVIEWAEMVRDLLPESTLEIRFFVKGPQKRELHLITRSPRLRKILKEILSAMARRGGG
jgi:tRNA threonylcarbamoyladenosine biosynthesis protein TsaE